MDLQFQSEVSVGISEEILQQKIEVWLCQWDKIKIYDVVMQDSPDLCKGQIYMENWTGG